MRFDELVIEKYGRYQSLALRLPAAPGLVVIYGPNEAGKSTCLAAISDFLFGIASHSSHGQLFGNEQIRLTATLRRADGGQLTLRRRKGRSKTLTDDEGKVVDDNVLSALLGATDRAKFSSLFGLNHESLRDGGKRLLAAEGDVGRLIVEAGGGLRVLVEQIGALDQEADRLFAPRKSAERAFYQALAAFEAAEKSVREGLVTREDYEQARQQHETAKLALEQRKKEQRALSEWRLQLERLVRIIPMLTDLAKNEQRLQALPELPPLRRGFAQSVREALASRQLAQQALDEAEQKRASLALHIEGLVASQELLASEAPIRDIIEKAKALTRQRSDRPNREKELAALEEKLSPLRRSIGVATNAELESRLPLAEVIAEVQQLVTQGLELRPMIHSLDVQIAEDTSALAALEQRQLERVQAGQDSAFGFPASEFDSLPRQVAARETRRGVVERCDQELESRLRELGFATLDELRTLPCPDAAVIQGELDARAALQTERLRHSATLTTELARQDAAVREITRLKEGGEVPTEGAIHAARKEREAAWMPIKTVYLAEDAQAVVALPISQRDRAIEKMEKLRDEADDLADRKSIEAQRIASLAMAEKRGDEADAAITAAKVARAELENKLAQAHQYWAATWAEVTKIEVDLGRLKNLAQKRQELLSIASSAATSRTEFEQMSAELDPRLESLALVEQQLGFTVAPHTSLGARVRSVNQRISAHDEAHRSYRDDTSRVESMRKQLQHRRERRGELIESEAKWQAAWKLAARSLGLAEQVSPTRANEVATEWAAASGTFEGIRLTRRRLDRMDEDETELRQMLGKLAPDLGLELPDDAVAAAHMLEDKWKVASKLASERSTLMPQLEQRTHERDGRRQALQSAEELLHELCSEAQCSASALPEVAERHAEWVALQDAQRLVNDNIFYAGDGKPVAFFREQQGHRSPDEVQAELGEIKADSQRLETELDSAAVQVDASKNKLAQFQTEEGYNHAVAVREQTAAELHRVVERYVEVALAKELLTAGLQLVREEQQDPLIRRAGELFALTTGGTFTAVETDVDGKGNPVVVGKRGASGTVTIDTMSDGSRDQLFLAFRLAHVEQYCDSTEPLPFIADDLLVHFDDVRSTATLELLAELGKKTQVLLFTHHRSVRETAQAMAAYGKASLIELEVNGLNAA